MAKIDGGCLCGRVRYQSDAEPKMTLLCHCRDCQKQTGGAFAINVVVPAESLNVSSEGTSAHQVTGVSGHAVWRVFCNNCGSSIYTKVEAMPGTVALQGGTLDDPSWLKPDANIWCVSAQPWVTIDKDMTHYDRNPDLG